MSVSLKVIFNFEPRAFIYDGKLIISILHDCDLQSEHVSEILILKIDKCFVWQSLPRKINLKKCIKSDATKRAPILYSSPISETFVMYFTERMLVGVRRTK